MCVHVPARTGKSSLILFILHGRSIIIQSISRVKREASQLMSCGLLLKRVVTHQLHNFPSNFCANVYGKTCKLTDTKLKT